MWKRLRMCPQARGFQSESEDGSEFHPWPLRLSSEMWSLKVTSCFPLSVFLSHRAPGSCHKKPERQSAITYDYS